MKDFEARLKDIEEKGLTRTLITLPGSGGRFVLDGKEYLNFSSNDYLDLANDSRVKKAAIAAVEKFGSGSGGLRLMCGTLTLHEELQKKLADWAGFEEAIVFGSGFLAN